MAKNKYYNGNSKRVKLLEQEEEEIDVFGSKREREDKKKITILELALNKDVNEVLKDLGSKNFSIKDIAIFIGMSPRRLQKLIDKGESDFNEDIVSEERMMYMNYMLGLKSLEAQTVTENLRFKNPDKLLAAINPEKYSDSMQDKYEVSKIEINFGDKTFSLDDLDTSDIEDSEEENIEE